MKMEIKLGLQQKWWTLLIFLSLKTIQLVDNSQIILYNNLRNIKDIE